MGLKLQTYLTVVKSYVWELMGLVFKRRLSVSHFSVTVAISGTDQFKIGLATV
jgi:hypothetical protein